MATNLSQHKRRIIIVNGGRGSGNYGHKGRDAENLRGGSAKSSTPSEKELLNRLEGEYTKPGIRFTEQMSKDFRAAKDKALTHIASGQFGKGAELLFALSYAQKNQNMDSSARSNGRLASRFENIEEGLQDFVKAGNVETIADARKYYVDQLKLDTDFMDAYGDFFK